MVRREVIRARLARLEAYLAILETLRAYDRDAFLRSPERYGSAERFLQLAIEAIDDIAAHSVADEGWGPVERASDLPERFLARGYVSPAFAEQWRRMIGFRNLLVHDYVELDRERVWAVLQENLDDLRAFLPLFSRFL